MNSVFSKDRLTACADAYSFEEEEESGLYDSFAANISDAEYEGMDIDKVIRENCQHLSEEEQQGLEELLRKHYKLFDGQLRTYTDAKMDIELKPGATP
eukprot:5411346-Alexandrium_andersonii.AAC.1